MLVKFYEVKTNTEQGVYKISDFYKPSWALFSMSDSPKGALVAEGVFNFDASDVMAELTIMLSDYAYPHRLTHVIAVTNPAETDHAKIKKMAYSVQSVEYMGQNQVKLHLIEDAFLAHIQETINSPILLQRSNDPSLFMEHDIADVAGMRGLSMSSGLPDGFIDYSGKWLLLTFKDFSDLASDDSLRMTFTYKKPVKHHYETFSTLVSATTKYPNIPATFHNPTSCPYLGKMIYISGTDSFYQFQYKAHNNKAEWSVVDFSYLYNTTVQTPLDLGRFFTKLVTGDLKTLNIALPIATNLAINNPAGYAVGDYPVIGAMFLDSMQILHGYSSVTTLDAEPYLIGKRIVDGAMIGIKGNYRPSTPDSDLNYVQASEVQGVIHPWTVGALPLPVIKYAFVFPTNLTINLQTSYSFSSVLDAPPFKQHFLSIWGNNIPLKPQWNNQFINIYSAISSSTWAVYVSVLNTENVIFKGEINSSLPYAIDKFSEFIAQNSNYNAIRTTNYVLGGGARIATGAISGFMAGNLTGAVIGGVTGLASLGQQIINDNLQIKAMKNAPDTINGSTSDFTSIYIRPFGIYFFTLSATSSAMSLMQTEYYAKGFPTNTVITSINSLTQQSNTIYGFTKLVVGSLIEMVYNFHVTSEINKRLQGGIYLCP